MKPRSGSACTRIDQGFDLVEHPEWALYLGVRSWVGPHNLKPLFAVVSSHGADSLTRRDSTGGCASEGERKSVTLLP